jgi:hypothetical protein
MYKLAKGGRGTAPNLIMAGVIGDAIPYLKLNKYKN